LRSHLHIVLGFDGAVCTDLLRNDALFNIPHFNRRSALATRSAGTAGATLTGLRGTAATCG
jgi:hypothetical protein